MEGDYKDDFKNALQFSTVPKVEPSEEVFILPGEFSENIPTAFPALPPPNVDKEDPLAENTTGDDSYKLKDSEVKDCLQNLLTIKTEEIKVELEDHCSQETQPVDKSSILHEDEHSSYELNTILPNKRKRALWIPQNISPVVPGTGPIPRKKQKNYAEDEITSPSESDNSDESYDPKTSLGDQSSPSESDSDYSYNPKRSIGSHTKKKQSSKGKKQPMKPVPAKEKLVGDSSNKNKGAISIPQIDSLPLLSEAAPSGKEKNKEWKLNDDSSNKQMGAISIPQHGSLPLVREAAPPWKKNKEGKMKWFLWSCCNKQFEEFSIFYKHKMQEHQIEEFRCSVCTDKLFTSLKDIEQHYLDIHTDSTWISYYCLDCRLLFGVKSSFDDHKAKCTESRVVCSKILDSMINFAVRRKKIKCQKPDGCKLCCCEKIFGNFEDFIAHKFSVHKIDLLTCGLCSYKKGSKMQLKYHYRKFHFPNYWDEMELESLRDKEAFPGSILTSRALEEMLNASDKHGIIQTNGRKCTAVKDGLLCQCFPCLMYVAQVTPNDNVKRKKSISNRDRVKPFSCDGCRNSFRSKGELTTHKLINHSTNPPKKACHICDKVFASRKSMEEHVKNVHLRLNKIMKLKCEFCEQTFSSRSALQRHSNQYHLQEQVFICGDCERVFYHKDRLITHIKSLHLQEKFSCVICNKVLSSKCGLDQHMKTHSTTRYSCEVCGKMFKSKAIVRSHMAIHTDENPFVCETCGKEFKRINNLQQHQLSHSKSKTHHCDLCGQSFKLRTHVKQHMAVHGVNKNHKCFVCNKAFAKKTQLNSHLSTHGI